MLLVNWNNTFWTEGQMYTTPTPTNDAQVTKTRLPPWPQSPPLSLHCWILIYPSTGKILIAHASRSHYKAPHHTLPPWELSAATLIPQTQCTRLLFYLALQETSVAEGRSFTCMPAALCWNTCNAICPVLAVISRWYNCNEDVLNLTFIAWYEESLEKLNKETS